MKLQNMVTKIKSFYQAHSERMKALFLATKMLMIVFLFVLIPTGEKPLVKPQNETRIKFVQNSPTPLVLEEKKVNIVSVGSREDLNNLDPEAIKGLMIAYSEKYDVDWKLVYAIGYHESGNFQSSLARNQYNFFGRKAASGGYASWSTPEDAIQNQFEYLQTRYIANGLDTPEKINKVYAEDMSWSGAINSVMNQL